MTRENARGSGPTLRDRRLVEAAAALTERRCETRIPAILGAHRHRQRLRLVTDWLRAILARREPHATAEITAKLIEIIYRLEPHRTDRTEELFKQIRPAEDSPKGEAA